MSGRDDESTPQGLDKVSDELPSLSLDDVVSEPFDDGSLAQLLGDRYTPLSRLGEGTFGEVVRARDSVLGREIAVKRIRLEAFGAPAQLEEVKTRFLREAQVAAQLHHPNIVTTHDIITKAGSSCIVMELVVGQDLQSLLEERGRLRLDETLDILGQVAAALDHAHDNGVIHRDIKPANIMIESAGRVKVMDFGIAKMEQGGSRTSTGLIMGTPSYMSPEQARGAKIDRRADVFSLGCVLYECLSGTKAFHDESLTAILLKVVAEPPPPIDFEALGLPRALDGVLKRAIAKEASLRFASAGELMEAARQAARGVEAPPRPVSPTGTLVASPAAGPPGPRCRSQPPPERALPRPPGDLGHRPGAEAALPAPGRPRRTIVIAGGILGVVFCGGRTEATPSGPPTPGGRLVVEEELGLIGSLFGQEPRLLITVPSETILSLEIQTAVSSATARRGRQITAQVVRPIVIEGHEAIAAGARVDGRVAGVQSAKEAGGRGRLTLEFGRITSSDGATVRIQSNSVELVAPPPRTAKRRRGGLAGAWDKVTSSVDEFVSDVKAELAGGVSGAQAVQGGTGVDISVPTDSHLSIRLRQEFTVARERGP